MKSWLLGGLLPLAFFACDDSTSLIIGNAPDADVPDAITVDVAADGGAIVSIDVSPFVLVPPFTPATHDYYVRCAAGDNLATLTVTDALGAQSSPLDMLEDQAVVVGGQYWIRCLPHDFPTIAVAAHAEVGAPTPGYYIVNGGVYATVLDTNGTPVWYTRGTTTIDVDSLATNTISLSPNETAPYGWSPTVRFDVHALDTTTTTTVMAAGSPTDAHELRSLPNGDWLLFSYPIEQHVDLTGLSTFGADENMANCEVQEIDGQGNVVWSWLATDHVDPVKESIEPAVNSINGQSVVDPFHCNSIDVDSSGNLLVSFRHANAVYYVERPSGDVQWKLGGAPYNLDDATYVAVQSDPQGAFDMQHDARFTPNGHVTLFDDHGAASGVARGVEYALDLEAETATMVFQFLGSGQSQYMGSFRRYADGHSVIGWGYVANDPRVITEIDGSGNDVLDIGFSGGPSYRAIKVPLSQLDIDLLRATTAK